MQETLQAVATMKGAADEACVWNDNQAVVGVLTLKDWSARKYPDLFRACHAIMDAAGITVAWSTGCVPHQKQVHNVAHALQRKL